MCNDSGTAGDLNINGPGAVANILGTYTKTGTGLLYIQSGGVLNLGGTLSWSGYEGIRVGNSSAGTFNMTSGSLTVNVATGQALTLGYKRQFNWDL